MAYGTVKVDNITFDNGGSDQNVTVSGLYRATTSGVTVSGTIAATTVSGVTVIGSTTVSGDTVTGTTANFTSGNFSNIISSAATMSGALIMANQQQVQFRESGGTNHIALRAPTSITNDQIITLPEQTGTLITTGDNGSVSSTMLATNLTISAAAGSAAAPSIAFTGDLNTGLYSPGADQLAVSTGGTGRLFVDSSGRILVGTTDTGALVNISANTAEDALRVTQTGTGNALVVEDSANPDNNPFVIDANGRVVQGHTTALTLNGTGGTPVQQIHTATSSLFANACYSAVNWGDTFAPAGVFMARARSGAIGTYTIVPTGQNLGDIRFAGADGVEFQNAAVIGAQVDDTPSAGIVPGRIIFETANSSGTLTEQMRIDSSGRVGIGTRNPLAKFVLGSSGGYPAGSAADDCQLVVQTANATSKNGLRIVTNNYGSASSAYLDLVNFGSKNFNVQSGFRITGGVDSGATGTSDPYLSFSTVSLGSDSTTATVALSERMRIDSSGRLLVGTSTARTNLYNATVTAQHQSEGISSASAQYLGTRNTNDSFGGTLVLVKSRGTSVGSNTIVQNGDQIGACSFQGADGTEFVEAARIEAAVDGTPGADDMPGRLVFSTTADGASSPTERMRIDSSGRVGIGTSSPGNELHIASASNVSGPLVRLQNTGTTSPATGYVGLDNNNVFLSADSGGGIVSFRTGGGSEKARIDPFGRLLVGTSSARGGFGGDATVIPNIQLEGTGAYNDPRRFISLVHNSASDFAPFLYLGKTRGTSNGAVTAVQVNDELGSIAFMGADGTDLKSAALIQSFVDGTPGANDMPGRLVFSTTADGASSPTERMRIDSKGSVLIGSTDDLITTTGVKLNPGGGENYFVYDTAPNTGQTIALNRTTDGIQIIFKRNNSIVGNIGVNTTTTFYTSSSDYRLKENVVPLTGAADRLKLIPVHRFNFIADPDRTVDGFIAHEVQAAVPECATGEKDAVDEQGNPVYQGIDQSKLVPLLTAALQEAIAKIETLEAKVAALEAA
jgi:hypothetical protein